MLIYLNGEEQQVPDNINMSFLVDQLKLSDRRIAVEVNAELVPRSTFDEFHLGPEDRVEIVHAIGGG